MLTTTEKADILKTVNIFAETPDEIVAEVAELLEEVDFKAGETVFEKGAMGTSMYIIVVGRCTSSLPAGFESTMGCEP
jgi:CRP-like cAMP-binding protein